MDNEPLLAATHFDDLEANAGFFSDDDLPNGDATTRINNNSDHFSFASKRFEGGKHRGANARDPSARTLGKVRNRFAKHTPKAPVRLVESKERLVCPTKVSTEHSPDRCADDLVTNLSFVFCGL